MRSDIRARYGCYQLKISLPLAAILLLRLDLMIICRFSGAHIAKESLAAALAVPAAGDRHLTRKARRGLNFLEGALILSMPGLYLVALQVQEDRVFGPT